MGFLTLVVGLELCVGGTGHKAMEIEILKRASAYFARENVLPKEGSGSIVSLLPRVPCVGGVPSRGRLVIGLLPLAGTAIVTA